MRQSREKVTQIAGEMLSNVCLRVLLYQETAKGYITSNGFTNKEAEEIIDKVIIDCCEVFAKLKTNPGWKTPTVEININQSFENFKKDIQAVLEVEK